MASSASGGAACCPRGTGWSGCARPTGYHPSACKVRDRYDRLVKKHLTKNLVKKHLTKNQMYGGRQTAGPSPRPKSLPIYINWYINGYGLPRTSSDPNSKTRPDHRRVCT